MKFKAKKIMKFEKYLEMKEIFKNEPEITLKSYKCLPHEINPHRVELVLEIEIKEGN
ncbi:hypothetical protein LCGC14_1629710 [marine sediment metagenome]|uniref:Uncharacterized protein n=1 Tax=marine sediment metagenome TaxID=412755 RepID=A0A0F9KIQ1_9ZZZZ|nr:MAG: hypothetical protein Lokiarch_05690 [Candidatus Lokiarchaeum sp. GC14_75]